MTKNGYSKLGRYDISSRDYNPLEQPYSNVAIENMIDGDTFRGIKFNGIHLGSSNYSSKSSSKCVFNRDGDLEVHIGDCRKKDGVKYIIKCD